MGDNSNLSLEQRAMQGAAMTPEERKRMWLSLSDITEAQFDALQAAQQTRQARVPQPGAVAPEFELDMVPRDPKPPGQPIPPPPSPRHPHAPLPRPYTSP